MSRRPSSGTAGTDRSGNPSSTSPSAKQAARQAGRLRLRRLVVILASALVVVAAGGIARHFTVTSDPVHAKTPSTPVHFSVGEANCTFVDTSRSTYDYATKTFEPDRRLVTEIRYPSVARAGSSASPAYRNGPFPMIVFAHGFDLVPEDYAPLLDEWVRAGFVVVAPIFPDTNHNAVTSAGGAGEQDVVNQPADLAFVTRAIVRAAKSGAQGCNFVRGLISSGPIGLVGQSDGGLSVGMLAFDKNYRSDLTGIRLGAVAVLSGAQYGQDHYLPAPGEPGFLVVQSATDQCNLALYSTALYADVAETHKWFLEIFNAPHLGPYLGTSPAALRVVAAVTNAFFRYGLDHSESASAIASVGNTTPSIARLSTGPTAPYIAPVALNTSTCYAS